MSVRAVLPGRAFADPEYRVEGRNKVSGRTKYAADCAGPDALWAAFAVSPHAHARITGIDVRAARAMPGVVAVLTAADIGPRRFGRQLYDWPVLAFDTVRFVGERVAAIAAVTREAAEAAARAVDAGYETLPALLDAATALQPGSAALHPDWDSYDFPAFAHRPRAPRAHPNIQGTLRRTKGAADLEPLFAGAAHVFEHHFETPRQHCGYIEPHATVVWIDAAGIVHVHSPNKSPFALRDQLARTTGLDLERIVVECTSVGGDFGGKGLTIDEFPCYYLAKATGRPICHTQTYGDELRAGTTRHRTTLALRTAVAADGTFIAHRSRVIYDGGAYAAGKPIPTLVPGFGYGTIPYRVPNVNLEVSTVYTNTSPAAHMRGPAEMQTFFAWEQHVDMMAAELRIDPLELRLRNVIDDGDTALAGEPLNHSQGRRVLHALRDAVGSTTSLGASGRGRGISLICTHTGGGRTSLRMQLRADGTIAIVSGVADQGAGAFTLLQRVAAEALGVDPARIVAEQGSTAETFTDPGAGASRVSHIAGRAAQDGAAALRALLESRSEMTLRDDRFFTRDGRSFAFEEIARQLAGEGPLEVVGRFDSDPPGSSRVCDYTFGAYAIDVIVDVATGAPTVIDALLVADVGPIINPIAHAGQINGGFVYGLGGALMEELALDEDGKVVSQSLGEYKLPTIRDVPPLRTAYIDTPPGNGPYGAKMVGELSNAGVAPAIANAIYDAVGVRLAGLPLTAERIYTALHEETA